VLKKPVVFDQSGRIYVVDTNGPNNPDLSLVKEDDHSFTGWLSGPAEQLYSYGGCN